jgi:hypothetical protein
MAIVVLVNNNNQDAVYFLQKSEKFANSTIEHLKLIGLSPEKRCVNEGNCLLELIEKGQNTVYINKLNSKFFNYIFSPESKTSSLKIILDHDPRRKIVPINHQRTDPISLEIAFGVAKEPLKTDKIIDFMRPLTSLSQVIVCMEAFEESFGDKIKNAFGNRACSVVCNSDSKIVKIEFEKQAALGQGSSNAMLISSILNPIPSLDPAELSDAQDLLKVAKDSASPSTSPRNPNNQYMWPSQREGAGAENIK